MIVDGDANVVSLAHFWMRGRGESRIAGDDDFEGFAGILNLPRMSSFALEVDGADGVQFDHGVGVVIEGLTFGGWRHGQVVVVSLALGAVH